MNNHSFLSQLIRNLPDDAPASEAEAITDTLILHSNLCQWLVTSVAAAGRDAGPMLRRSAQFMRDELSDFTAGDHLDRMATDFVLLKSVISELRAHVTTAQRQPNLANAL